MTQEVISIISTIVNLLLAFLKIGGGAISGSIALIADGFHSGLDIFSSFVTFLGIKASKKPVDKRHPYGYYRAELIAGFVVTILLFISASFIFYEGIQRFFKIEPLTWILLAQIIIGISILINEIIARVKFYYGNKFESLSLIADGFHSRADAISSLGVFVGLILSKWFIYADALAACLIAIFIFYKTFLIGKEITDSLLDVADPELEKKIKKICKERKIEIDSLKTRKIGSISFAELKIKLSPLLKLDEVNLITKNLEEELLRDLPELKHIVISVGTHEFQERVVKGTLGWRYRFKKGFRPIGPPKVGKRIIIPLENKKLSDHFGAKEYLLIDKDKKGNIIKKEIIKNPYFEEGAAHGFKFARSVSADKVLVKNIGENARRNLKAFGIEIELIKNLKELE